MLTGSLLSLSFARNPSPSGDASHPKQQRFREARHVIKGEIQACVFLAEKISSASAKRRSTFSFTFHVTIVISKFTQDFIILVRKLAMYIFKFISLFLHKFYITSYSRCLNIFYFSLNIFIDVRA